MRRLPELAIIILLICSATNARADASIHAGIKTLYLNGSTVSDPALFDASGRERLFHGWNVSGSVKLASQGFKPFKSRADAEHSFALMRRDTGANLIRFTLSWEGTEPAVEQLDTEYLDAIAEQVKAAIAHHIYVFLDYHTDLYSRWLFDDNDPFTGNGAPRWVIDGGDYSSIPRCTVLCFNWSMHNILNPRVRKAYRDFWDNAPIYTLAGERHVQDAFLWQLHQSLLYLKTKFTPTEMQYIVGLEPFNEPNYGKGHRNTADEFDNDKLWPFYRRVRAVMDEAGWTQQFVFAEPLVFWDTNAGFFTPPTGGHYLRDIPASGFVFAPHFYDAARMGVTNLTRVKNADYFPNLDDVRSEARFLHMPVVLGEFGMWLGNQNGGSRDYARIVNATYEAMEASDVGRTQKDRHLDFYTMPVSGTQWHWDIYKDRHAEPRNDNPDHIMQSGDGWNGEDFSAVKGDQLTVGADIVGRIYPRAIQGRLVNFFYYPHALDGAGRVMDWAAIELNGKRYFGDHPFALLTWQGTDSRLPTEIFIPPQYQAEQITVVTENNIWQPGESSDTLNWEDDDAQGGHRLLIRADSATPTALHAALVLVDVDADAVPNDLPQQLAQAIDHFVHPVVLTDTMTGQNYVPDPPVKEAVQVTVSTTRFLVFRQIVLNWNSPVPVVIKHNNNMLMTAGSSGRKRFFSLIGLHDRYQICRQDQPDQCSRLLQFQ